MVFVSAKRIQFIPMALIFSIFNSFRKFHSIFVPTHATHTTHTHTHARRLLCNEVNVDDAFDFEYRGPVMMKGKAEPMKCWFLNRAKCDYPNIPHADDLMKSQIETNLTCGY